MKLPRANFMYFFSLIFITLFCFLGHWQLTRYHSKKELIAAAASALSGPAVTLTGAEKEMPAEFSRIALYGQYDNASTVLVENKTYHGQVGYEVFTAFNLKTASHLTQNKRSTIKQIWVDRGWIAARPLAAQLGQSIMPPSIPAAVATQAVVGHVRHVGGYQFMLGRNIQNPAARPLVMQKMDISNLSTIFHASYYPFILRLDKTAPHGFVRDWVITTLSPAQHLGYSIQWFAMAVVLLLMSIYFTVTRRRSL